MVWLTKVKNSRRQAAPLDTNMFCWCDQVPYYHQTQQSIMWPRLTPVVVLALLHFPGPASSWMYWACIFDAGNGTNMGSKMSSSTCVWGLYLFSDCFGEGWTVQSICGPVETTAITMFNVHQPFLRLWCHKTRTRTFLGGRVCHEALVDKLVLANCQNCCVLFNWNRTCQKQYNFLLTWSEPWCENCQEQLNRNIICFLSTHWSPMATKLDSAVRVSDLVEYITGEFSRADGEFGDVNQSDNPETGLTNLTQCRLLPIIAMGKGSLFAKGVERCVDGRWCLSLLLHIINTVS